MNPIVRRSALSVAGFLITSGFAAGPAIAADPPPVTDPPAATAQPPPAGRDDEHLLDYDYQRQKTEYYCAPAATAIALSTQGKSVSQREVANKLGTTTAGTESVEDTTRVLNEMTGGGYETTEIPGEEAQPPQVQKLRTDVVEALDSNRAVVANIMGTAEDTEGNTYSYLGGHYLSIVGYEDGGEKLKIADPYDRSKDYWMDDEDVADWIAERGYSS
ncbi:C39 family peptidase [Micromonospora sp. GCM10011542]|uniref:C39 family peptidase n=1 Tax=Micromonospora sp. GCM10011542 TaxID=3317337 RepID=UPI0036215117